MVKARVITFLMMLWMLPLTMVVSCADGVPLIAVQVAPLCVDDFQPGQQQQFNACIFVDGVRQPGFENDAVTWSVLGGDVNGVITQAGLYTAPNTQPPPAAEITIIATSIEDDQKQGQATVVFVGMGACETEFSNECM